MRRCQNELAEWQERLISAAGEVSVAREHHGKYFVCPHYEDGAEGVRADAGYGALGVLVKESW